MKNNLLFRHTTICFGILLFISCLMASCMEDFLDVKYNFSQVIPESLEDYQAIMDNSTVINYYTAHGLGIVGGDEFYVRDEVYNGSLPATFEKNTYIWARDIFGMEEVAEWNHGYKRILHTNIVLDGLGSKTVAPDEEETKRNIIGSALFVRAFSFFQLSQLFCKQYDPVTANADLGIPLRLESDVNMVVKRSTLQETFDQIISDLKLAIEMLPETTTIKERPSKAAGRALLARVYLQIGDYGQALYYAELVLSDRAELIDFNDLENLGEPNGNGSYYTFNEMVESNPEILFTSRTGVMSLMYSYPGGNLTVDTLLMKSYWDNDLRKKAFFLRQNDTDAFIGSYTGGSMWFTGLALDEVYLIKAEAACRTGQMQGALNALNYLLSKRIDKTFISYTSNSQDEVLKWILEERRKEFFFRGIRWSDLKRLNKDPQFATTLYREVNGVEYELEPNSPLYVLPIPYPSILQSGLQDNVR